MSGSRSMIDPQECMNVFQDVFSCIQSFKSAVEGLVQLAVGRWTDEWPVLRCRRSVPVRKNHAHQVADRFVELGHIAQGNFALAGE